MNFKFNIDLTDKDYLDYNIFWMLKSPYGKKQMIKYRIIISVIFLAVIFLSLLVDGFTAEAFLGIIPYLVLLVLVEAFLNFFFVWTLKGLMKSLKGKGNMGYTPVAEMEFYDEYFLEVTPVNKTESKYSSVERVSVVGDKVIYIHVNNVMSYILPMASFESREQYGEFLEFIKTKCANVDIY